MPRPLFLSGTARGGTNLLAQLLSAHRNLSIASDPMLPVFRSFRSAVVRHRASDAVRAAFDPQRPLSDYYFTDERIRLMECIQAADWDVPFDAAEWPAVRAAIAARTSISSPYLVPQLRELAGQTYREIVESGLRLIARARKAEDRRWVGFNENWTAEFFTSLARSFPEAKFILLLRDPRAAVASNQRVPDPREIAHVVSFARHWRKYVALAAHYERSPLFSGRVLVVRYEQLVCEPQRTAEELCRFLDVEFQPAMLDPRQYIDHTTGKTWAGNSNQGQSRPEIYQDSIERWKQTIAPEIGKTVEWICDPDLRLLGLAPAWPSDDDAPDPSVTAFVLKDHAGTPSWRSDLGDPALDLGAELLRKSLLRAQGATPPDERLVRLCFLFPEVYERLLETADAVTRL